MRIVVDLFRNSNSGHWKEGLTWFVWNFCASLLPVWLTILIFCLLKKSVGFSTFTSNGELAIYSATCIAGSLYLLMKDIKNKAFPNRSILGLISFVLIVIAAATFAAVCVVSTMSITGKNLIYQEMLDTNLLRNISLVLYPTSLFFSLIIFVADQVLLSPDVRQMARDQLSDLERQFDSLREVNNDNS